MTIEIKVPAMGESVSEATVARWFKKEGDAVVRDEPLLELETDKVTVEVPAPASGAIESIAVKAGDTVQVGAVLGASPKARPARRRPSPRAIPIPRHPSPRRKPPPLRRLPPPLRRPLPGPPRRSRCRRRAASARRTISIPPASRAPAGTAASPRATCWPRSKRAARRSPRRRPPFPLVRVPTPAAKSA